MTITHTAMIYSQAFDRMNFRTSPPLTERVEVVFETDIPFDDEHIEEFVAVMWGELFRQYPLWRCPYHQSNPPPTELERWRHSFCSPAMRDGVRMLSAAAQTV